MEWRSLNQDSEKEKKRETKNSERRPFWDPNFGKILNSKVGQELSRWKLGNLYCNMDYLMIKEKEST